MSSLDQILADTLLFAAARGRGVEPQELHSGSVECPRPKPLIRKDGDYTEAQVRANPIWHWRHNGAIPGRFDDVTVLSRGMGMGYRMPVPVARRVEVRRVTVRNRRGRSIDLPLTPDAVVRRYFLRQGHVAEAETGLWQMPHRTDASLMTVLAYQVSQGFAVPLGRDAVAEFGNDLLPGKLDRVTEFFAGKGITSGKVFVDEARYVVAIQLVPCKESDDFFPGGLLGTARLYPVVMVSSSEPLERVEVEVDVERSAKAMTHGDPTMEEDFHPLLVTDTNTDNAPFFVPRNETPPYWNLIFDYYETDVAGLMRARTDGLSLVKGDHPLQREDEVCLADARHVQPRTCERAVWRDGFDESLEPSPIEKRERQGQFDSVHLAPRMQFQFLDKDEPGLGGGTPVRLTGIAMAPFCVHDCLHLHTRWAHCAEDKGCLGFLGSEPHKKAGAPLVPANQTVFVSFPKAAREHSLRYRAFEEDVSPGDWSCFMHHGLTYAVEEWPTTKARALVGLIHKGIATLAAVLDEPYARSMPQGYAGLYWRLRFKALPEVERLHFNRERCMR